MKCGTARGATRRVASTPAFRYIALAALVIGAGIGCNGGEGAPVPTGSDGAPLTRIIFENDDGDEVYLFVEVADAQEERSRGLMARTSLPEDQGMIFVFQQAGTYSFYMRNTPLPLSIAFIEGDGRIIEIEDMQPLTEDLHTPDAPYLYGVEVNQGWFQRNGISAGSVVRIPLTPVATSPPPS